MHKAYALFDNKFCTGGAFFPNLSKPMLQRLFFFAPSFARTTSGGTAGSSGLRGSSPPPTLLSGGTVCVRGVLGVLGLVCVGVVSGAMTEVRPAWVK